MIIEEIHYEVRRRWDKLNSLHKRKLTPLEIDNTLYQATQDYIEMFVHGTPMAQYNLTIEWNQQRSNMIKPFIVSYPEQPLISPVSLGDGIYQYELPATYRSYLSSAVLVPSCGGKYFNVDKIQHEDLNSVLIDYHSKPSKKWWRAIGVIRGDYVYVYTNEEFVPSGMKLTYVRQPARPCLGTYESVPTEANPLPAIKPKVESDIPEDYHNLLIEMAVQKLHRIFNEVDGYRLSELEQSKIK